MRRIRKDLPRTRVLIYSGTSDPVMMKEALRERPHGYVEKLQGLKILRDAISTIAGGGTYFSTETAQALYETSASRADGLNLSAREREILQMVAEGRSSKQISGLLEVAVKTVENHRANLMAKLDMHDVASLTRYAACQGLVALE